MSIKLTIHGRWFSVGVLFFSVKHKFCSSLDKAWGLSALLMLIFARFEFDLGIYCNFCRFEFHLFIDSYLWEFYAMIAM